MAKIALDYDETYTINPEMWNEIINTFQKAGNEVMIVTFRSDDLPIDHDPGIPVFYTAWNAKRPYMEKQGIDIDVWIDDSPELIIQNSAWTDADRELWKQENSV